MTRSSFTSVATLSFLLPFLNIAHQTNAQTFNLVQESSGSTFFDKWDFAPAVKTYDNTTNGDVFFVTKDQAFNAEPGKGLAYVNSKGNAILRTDNFTTVLYPEKRDTVRITSQKQFEIGSLFVADILHLPFGCSVWPSFWTKGVNWPEDGEIDIIEGINQNPNNQMALHTTEGCLHPKITDPTLQSGNAGELNCNATGNIGCTVIESKPGSLGQSFNQNGGGVFATQFDAAGIFIWFWPRANVPASIKASTSTSSLSLADWGPPSASYPNVAGGCDISKHFAPQSLILQITLCGDWAGAEYFKGCGKAPTTTIDPLANPTDIAKTTCYNERVLGPPSGYDDAFFEIQYVRVYSNNPPSTSASSSSSTSQPSATNSGSAGSGNAGGSSSATGIQAHWSLAIPIVMLWLCLTLN